MNELPRSPRRILVITYFIVLHIVAVYFVIDRSWAEYGPVAKPPTTADPAASPTDGPPSSPARPGTNSAPAPPATTETPTAPAANPGGLIIPVLGVKGSQLTDSFADARSSARSHDAIDIPAPAGTPVLAAADGEIIKFFDSELGGITIYQLSADRNFVYYYAHLQRRADDVTVGMRVRQGKTIAYVGDTGNAGVGNYHLHFSIAAVTDPKRYWEGVYINPYPLLKDQGK